MATTKVICDTDVIIDYWDIKASIKTYTLSHGLALPDSLIAATAIHTGMDLFTYNIKDFRFISYFHLYTSAV